jgi:hypothetical protein
VIVIVRFAFAQTGAFPRALNPPVTPRYRDDIHLWGFSVGFGTSYQSNSNTIK